MIELLARRIKRQRNPGYAAHVWCEYCAIYHVHADKEGRTAGHCENYKEFNLRYNGSNDLYESEGS